MTIRILAIDTTTEACSAALISDNNLLYERFLITNRNHAQFILSMIDSLLIEANIKLYDLDALAFSRGPGSFTGTRISLGIAQGLGIGANLPLIGISTLAALAEGAWRKTKIEQVLVAIDAKIDEVYFAQYQRQTNGLWKGEETETIIKLEALDSLLANMLGCWAIAGTFCHHKFKTIFSKKNCFKFIHSNTSLPSAQNMLPIALYNFHNNNIQSPALAELKYINPINWKKISK